MNTLRMARPTPATVSERMFGAWAAAHPITRRALVAACVTSMALGALVPLAAPAGAGIALCGAVLAAAALVDLHEQRLPNRLLVVALAATVVSVVVAGEPALVGRAAIGMLLGGGLLLLVRLTRGVGMGDVKMAAVVGASTAPLAIVSAPVAIAIAAMVAAGYGLLAKRTRLPLGPALWLGWAAALAAGVAGWLS